LSTFRKGIITSPGFTGERIIGAILFEGTMDRDIHPELFERLSKDWASLDKFQRTRGHGERGRSAVARSGPRSTDHAGARANRP
jgi:hypothetical protein